MYEFQASPTTVSEQLLSKLEGHLMMLSDADQGFVIGCRHHLDSGAQLTQANKAELRRIVDTLENASHATLEKPLSISQMLKDLASNPHVLSFEEKKFLNRVAHAVKSNTKMGSYDVELLVKLYSAKGF